MAEEVSQESKIYVKEEIEKVRKEFKEDLEKANSRATKAFATVVMIIGLMAGVGIIGSVKYFISRSAMANLEEESKRLHGNIVKYEEEAKDIISSKVIIGMIVPYGGEIEEKTGEPTEVKEGWLLCNGVSLERDKYEKLFGVIGKAFGAPDPDHFNLPDIRGRFVRGVDVKGKTKIEWRDPDHDARSESAIGGNKGNKVGSIQMDALKRHTHKYFDYEKALAQGGEYPGAGGKTLTKQTLPSEEFKEETRPKNVYVNWIIKAR